MFKNLFKKNLDQLYGNFLENKEVDIENIKGCSVTFAPKNVGAIALKTVYVPTIKKIEKNNDSKENCNEAIIVRCLVDMNKYKTYEAQVHYLSLIKNHMLQTLGEYCDYTKIEYTFKRPGRTNQFFFLREDGLYELRIWAQLEKKEK